MLKAEQIEQIKLFNWIRTRPDIDPYAIHIGNERSCSPQHGRILKRMGIKRGCADIFIAIPKRGMHGLWIELKSQSGKLSESQIEFIESMASQGYMATCCYGYEAARKVIEAYLKESVSCESETPS